MKNLILLCLLFITIICATNVHGDCDFTSEEFVNENTNLVTQITSKCTTTCEGDCKSALTDYFGWIEECSESITGVGLNLNTLTQAVDNIFDAICDGGSLRFLQCGQESADAYDQVLAQCSGGGTCSQDCLDAQQKHYRLFYECLGFEDDINDTVFKALNGQIETLCNTLTTAQACAQNSLNYARRLRDKCGEGLNGDGECNGSCISSIDKLDSLSDECPAVTGTVLGTFKKVCDDCGAETYAAYDKVEKECGDIDSSNLGPECPADCSDAIDDLLEEAKCFPEDSIIYNLAELIHDTKESACAPDLAAACALKASVDDYDDVLKDCAGLNACSSACYETLSQLTDEYSDCNFDGDDNIQAILDRLTKICDLTERNIVKFTLSNIDKDEIEDNIEDFLRRLGAAFNTNWWTIIITHIENGNTRDSTVIEAECTEGCEASAQGLQDAGLQTEGEVESEGDSCPTCGGGGGSGSGASFLGTTNALLILMSIALWMFWA